MLRAYLEYSSIHGLFYVGSARSPLSRALWLVCVCACATAAAVISFYNVVAWENSPAVVTSVNRILVQVRILMGDKGFC